MKLRLEIPKREFDDDIVIDSYGKGGYYEDDEPKLFIAKTVDDEAVECGSEASPLACNYIVFEKHGNYIIKAWIEAKDPRAFAS